MNGPIPQMNIPVSMMLMRKPYRLQLAATSATARLAMTPRFQAEGGTAAGEGPKTLLQEVCDATNRFFNALTQGVSRAWNALWNLPQTAAQAIHPDKDPYKPGQVPRLVMTDAYNIGSGPFVSPDARESSTYHVILARANPPWAKDLHAEGDKRIVFYGLQLIMDELFSKPITRKEVDEAEKFLKTAHVGGLDYKFDRKMWDRVVDECHGILPIKIEALKEGSVAFVGEPVMQITAKEGFGELASWFEAKLLQCYATSERATLMRHWLDRNKALVQYCSDKPLPEDVLNNKAAMMTHDFGDRASSCPQESEWLGLAHLTSGHVTSSTFSAGYRAWKDSGEKPIGGWIKSLAHRIVQGYDKEKDAYNNLYKSEPYRVTSHVSDCYDYYRAVDKYLIPLAKQARKEFQTNPQNFGVILTRPDSGDMTKQIFHALISAVNAGLYKTVTARDGRKLIGMTHLRIMSADEMNFQKMEQINNMLLAAGFSPPDCLSYGVGGGLRDAVSRKHFSTKMAIAAVGKDDRPVMKFSVVPVKTSIPGRVKVVHDGTGLPTVRRVTEPGVNELITRYDPEKGIVNREGFLPVRDRVLRDWDKFKYNQPTDILSPEIHKLQSKLRAKYVTSSYNPTKLYGKLETLAPVSQGIINREIVSDVLKASEDTSVADHYKQVAPNPYY